MKQSTYDLLKGYITKINYCYTQLESKEKELNGQLEAIKAERANLEEKQRRASHPPTNIDVICPICYLEQGSTIELSPIQGDSTTDKFQCRHCGFSCEENIE